MPSPSWETRREGELSAVYLGRVLEWIGGLDDLPRRARQGHFDDYFCPPEVDDGMNMHRLIAELRRRKTKLGPVARQRVDEVVAAIMVGEFDGTKAESDRWAASKQGQDLFRQLAEGR